MSKERPILFSGEMVRAILEGRKTQTRRVVKGTALRMLDDGFTANFVADPGNSAWCPYGQAGDALWVRETFVLQNDVEGEAPPFEDGRPIQREDSEYSHYTWLQPHYRATDPEPELDMGDGSGPCCKWTPSIHMPRWASRIALEVAAVRIERVQEISEADANREGCPLPAKDQAWTQCRLWYQQLWDKINAKRGFGWDINPWVWVIEFQNERSEVSGQGPKRTLPEVSEV